MIKHEDEILCEDCQRNRISWKKLLSTKSFWVSILVILISLLSGLTSLEWLIEYPKVASLLGTLLGTLMLVFRVMSNTDILVKEQEKIKNALPKNP